MVAVATPSTSRVAARGGWLGWTMAAGAALIIGLGIRVGLRGGGAGDWSAIVMVGLLSVGVWLLAILLTTPRAAWLILVSLVAVFDVAALPARNPPEYDDLQAFYRTDQVIAADVPVASDASLQARVLAVLVQPVFGGNQPGFGLAGEINGTSLAWDCVFQRGIQRLALPLPAGVMRGSGAAEIRLHLTGSPSRETDYLLVYASSRLGGFLMSMDGADVTATTCSLK